MAWLLNWLLSRVTFKLYISTQPLGRRLGGHNIPNVTDSYIILEMDVKGMIYFIGYFQTT
jgi:hypothetical protein